jgi:hypothetical protein
MNKSEIGTKEKTENCKAAKQKRKHMKVAKTQQAKK